MPITRDEWEILVDAYRQVIPDQPTPTEIVLLNGGGRLLAGNCCFQVFSGTLDFCDECYALWGIREEEKRYNYPEGANIFVRLVSFFCHTIKLIIRDFRKMTSPMKEDLYQKGESLRGE